MDFANGAFFVKRGEHLVQPEKISSYKLKLFFFCRYFKLNEEPKEKF